MAGLITHLALSSVQIEYMVVSKKSILLAYQMLRTMEPFASWRLPTKIQTKVVNDPLMYGCFEDSPDTITISAAKCWSVEQLTATVAHEMIHLYQHRLKILDEKNPHDLFFHEQARVVTVTLGFDKENF